VTNSYSQTEEFDLFLANGKAEFKKEFENQDYSIAVENLEKAVKLQPDNAEAHYFLGYAYSRLNSKDGNGIIQMSNSLTIKCSNEFEIVNRLSPKYTGENIILDPYSKLSAEWGSLAIKYLYNNQQDSSIWAFKEGKKRGGFGDFFLSINKAILDQCSKNAILITSGDNFTILMWYLQSVEGYRKDISVIDISLLNTNWYPSFLSKNGIIKFDLPESIIDTLDYCVWSDSTITINNFSWTIKPSYFEQYIIRGDRIFLSLLKENEFKRDIYFTIGFSEETRLSLKEFLQPLILIDKLKINKEPALEIEYYKSVITKFLLQTDKVNLNSILELNFIDNIRYDILNQVANSMKYDKKKEANELFNLMEKYAGEKKYPYQDENLRKYVEYIRGKL
jgi:hypothetical protein